MRLVSELNHQPTIRSGSIHLDGGSRKLLIPAVLVGVRYGQAGSTSWKRDPHGAWFARSAPDFELIETVSEFTSSSAGHRENDRTYLKSPGEVRILKCT